MSKRDIPIFDGKLDLTVIICYSGNFMDIETGWTGNFALNGKRFLKMLLQPKSN